MPSENPEPRPLLEYKRPEPAHRRLRPDQISLIALGAGILAAITLMSLEYVALGALVLVFAFIGGFGGLFFTTYRKATMHHRQTESEYEAAWHAVKGRQQELLEIAARVYAKGPIGNWRWTNKKSSMVVGLAEEVHAHRWITFTTEGQGRYGWERFGHPGSAGETGFEYKIDGTSAILVRLITLPDREWHQVRYGFETAGRNEEDLNLRLWFDSDNPLPRDLSEHWPFQGEFLRSAK